MDFLLVTGLSGSGKSGAVNVLEDNGYYCVDNIPPELIKTFADICLNSEGKLDKVAVVADIRSGDMLESIADTVKKLRKDGKFFKILFLDASDEVLLKRYKETRRKHPLDEETGGNLHRAIEIERERLTELKALSDYYIDTSLYSVAKLKERISSMFLDNETDSMTINVMSFGFKHGSLNEADLMFDVRCLPNPFYIPELKNKTGLDKEVSSYVMSFEESQTLRDKLFDLLDFLIPLYIKEGKSQLVLGFGCTGGKHRSVTFAELVGKYLREKNYNVRIEHRDYEK